MEADNWINESGFRGGCVDRCEKFDEVEDMKKTGSLEYFIFFGYVLVIFANARLCFWKMKKLNTIKQKENERK